MIYGLVNSIHLFHGYERNNQSTGKLWPFSQKFLGFFVRFQLKNFLREILRAFHKRIRSMSNLKISLTRNSTLATVSNGLIFLYKSMNRGFHNREAYYRPQVINISEINVIQDCLKTVVTITTCGQKQVNLNSYDKLPS